MCLPKTAKRRGREFPHRLDPIWTSTVRTPTDFAIALLAFAALVWWRVPAWIVVLLTAAGAALIFSAPGA